MYVVNSRKDILQLEEKNKDRYTAVLIGKNIHKSKNLADFFRDIKWPDLVIDELFITESFADPENMVFPKCVREIKFIFDTHTGDVLLKKQLKCFKLPETETIIYITQKHMYSKKENNDIVGFFEELSKKKDWWNNVRVLEIRTCFHGESIEFTFDDWPEKLRKLYVHNINDEDFCVFYRNLPQTIEHLSVTGAAHVDSDNLPITLKLIDFDTSLSLPLKNIPPSILKMRTGVRFHGVHGFEDSFTRYKRCGIDLRDAYGYYIKKGYANKELVSAGLEWDESDSEEHEITEIEHYTEDLGEDEI